MDLTVSSGHPACCRYGKPGIYNIFINNLLRCELLKTKTRMKETWRTEQRRTNTNSTNAAMFFYRLDCTESELFTRKDLDFTEIWVPIVSVFHAVNDINMLSPGDTDANEIIVCEQRLSHFQRTARQSSFDAPCPQNWNKQSIWPYYVIRQKTIFNDLISLGCVIILHRLHSAQCRGTQSMQHTHTQPS